MPLRQSKIGKYECRKGYYYFVALVLTNFDHTVEEDHKGG